MFVILFISDRKVLFIGLFLNGPLFLHFIILQLTIKGTKQNQSASLVSIFYPLIFFKSSFLKGEFFLFKGGGVNVLNNPVSNPSPPEQSGNLCGTKYMQVILII